MSLTAASTGSAGLTAAAAPSGMVVTVAGTNLSASVDVLGHFELSGVPSGSVELQFKHGSFTATVQLSNVGDEELVTIQVTVTQGSATVLDEVRTTGRVSLCHSTGNGSYQMIEVSASAEPAHRAHGDGKVGDQVPADPTKAFDANCRPVAASVNLTKSTNGQDANDAPGPTIAVGAAVTWTYVVQNTGEMDLTNVAVSDDRGVSVTCPAATLAAGQSMTCTGSGVATAGQYRNVGTVTASAGTLVVRDTDASHYYGQAPDTDEQGPKVQLCHRTGNGSYHLIEVSVGAEAAHRAHGDAKVGEAVPGSAGRIFTASCGLQ